MLLYLLTLTEESNHGKIEYLYNSYYTDMMDFAKIKLMDAGRKNFTYDAEDAVQNTFVKIINNIENVDFSRENKNIRGFVFSILTNEIYNILREKEIFTEYDEEKLSNVNFNYIETLIIIEQCNDAIEAIKKMDDKYSSTLYLAICEEMPVKDIAKLMGISEKTVYTRLARGKKLLLNSVRGVKTNG